VYLALGPSGIFWREVASGGSYLARLGELGSNHLPHFFYKMALGVEGKGFSTLGIQNSLKISEEKKKEEKNQSLRASVTLLRCFRDQFRGRSLSIFNRLVFYFEALNAFIFILLLSVFFSFVLSEFQPNV